MKTVFRKLLQLYGRHWPIETKKVRAENGKAKTIHIKFRTINTLRKYCPIKGDIVTRFDRNIKILIDLNDWLDWQIYYLGYYEKTTTKLIKKLFHGRNTFFDIGANTGYYSLLGAEKNLNVYAFEALPDIARILEMNKKLNDFKNINIINKAVYKENGTIMFTKPDKGNRGAGAISQDGMNSNTIKVDTCTLDSFVKERKIKCIDIVKIDVQGFELEVLEGSVNLLTGLAPEIVCEKNYEDNRLEDHLKKFGYTPFFIKEYDTSFKKILKAKYEKALGENLFFTRNPEKHSSIIY